MTTRRGLRRRWSEALILASTLAVGLYAWQVEPRWVEVVDTEVRSAALCRVLRGLVVVQVADLHFTSAADPLIQVAASELAALDPDLVLVTGDLTGPGGTAALASFVSSLSPRLGLYAIPGDSDHDVSVARLADAVAPGRLLVEEAVTLDLPAGRLHVVGSSGGWSMIGLLTNIPATDPLVLMVPDLDPLAAPMEDGLLVRVDAPPGDDGETWRWVTGVDQRGRAAVFSFETGGDHLLRVQRGQHGMLVDEFTLEPLDPGPLIGFHHQDRRPWQLGGCFQWMESWGATHGLVLADWPAMDTSDRLAPVPAPEHFATVAFAAPPGVPYRVRARVRAHGQGHGSWFVQFSDSVGPDALPVYRIGRATSPFGTRAPDLVLTAGTHGGQVWLPWVSKWLFGVQSDRGRFLSGDATIRSVQVHLNRGIGTSHLPIRFLARPEITRLTCPGSAHTEQVPSPGGPAGGRGAR